MEATARMSENRMSVDRDELTPPDKVIIGETTYSRECTKFDVSINFHALKAGSIKRSTLNRCLSPYRL